ncbi:SymE family type I addiction module toxin [Chitinophaga sp. Ak27]|uniref:SymE family type I addiction module toxin n=1 Tax=Chitinophaga sp. Ak27 TaxID=2726116 RepID=UPI00145CE6DE|nr:SymE family type I addiction module toxin [Chitinophaga sp. Ak27]NLU92316.1 type I toxin-antitoxin system SymE family toxin [Chitinophaga sp. Ak27]
MKNTNRTRHLTVHYIHQERTYDSKRVSCISLTGVWLEHAGFIVGDKIAVHVEDDRIIISKLKQDSPVIPAETPNEKATIREIVQQFR